MEIYFLSIASTVKSGVSRSILLLLDTECCQQEKDQVNVMKHRRNRTLAANWGTEIHFQLHFAMPHTVNVSCWFAIRSMLCQILLCVFLQNSPLWSVD